MPLLGDIPGLGVLFRRTIQKKSKTELLIFLTPQVAEQPTELEGMSKDELAGTKAIRSAVTEGALNEHLEGMQRGASTRPAGPDAGSAASQLDRLDRPDDSPKAGQNSPPLEAVAAPKDEYNSADD